jgi:hypothetical protein
LRQPVDENWNRSGSKGEKKGRIEERDRHGELQSTQTPPWSGGSGQKAMVDDVEKYSGLFIFSK